MRVMEYTHNISLANDEIGYMITNGDHVDSCVDFDNLSNQRNPSLEISLKSFRSSNVSFEEFYDTLSEPQYDECELDLPSSVIAELKLGLQGKSQQWKLVATRVGSGHTFYFDLWNFTQLQKTWEMQKNVIMTHGFSASITAISRLLPFHVCFYLERGIRGVEVIISEQSEMKRNAKTYGLRYYGLDESQEGELFAGINEYSRKKHRLKRQLKFRCGAKESDIIIQTKEYSY